MEGSKLKKRKKTGNRKYAFKKRKLKKTSQLKR